MRGEFPTLRTELCELLVIPRLAPPSLSRLVAHARDVRLIGESRRKDDRMDAQTLARLARIFLRRAAAGVQPTEPE